VSLLLDALRRAAAAKEGADDQYTVPQRDGATSPAPRARRPAPERVPPAAAAGEDAEQELPEPDLALEPYAEDSPAAEAPGAGRAAPQPDRAAAEPGAATRALLGGSRRGHGHRLRTAAALLGGVLLVGAALIVSGWIYYSDSRDAVERDLAAYRPERVSASVAPDAAQRSDSAEREPGAAAVQGGQGDAEEAAAAPGVTGGSAAPAPAGTDPAGSAAGRQPADEGTMTTETDGQARPEAPGASARTAEKNGEDTPGAGESAAQAESAQSAPEPADESKPERAATGESTREASSREPARQQAAPETPRRKAQPLVRASGQGALAEALQAGYSAYRAGDLERADRAYARARSLAPDNRDALLGAAAVARARGDNATAQRLYRRVLRDHPRDTYARAALSSLDGAGDPRRNETELKMLLRDSPDSPELHFALGNLYARESRWAQAQSAYFEAVRGEPDDPQYAYNLAIALDHLGQAKAARRYYQRALELADGRAVPFRPAAVRRRLEQLR